MTLFRRLRGRREGNTRSGRPRPAPPGRDVSGAVDADRHPGGAGFTLVELTVVVALIGILAGIAVYSYRMMVNKARMTQAKTVLIHLARTEAIYHGEYDRYTDNVLLLDFDPVKYPFYQVSVVLDNIAMNFTGTATGVGPMTGDRWYVTKAGIPFQDNTSPFR